MNRWSMSTGCGTLQPVRTVSVTGQLVDVTPSTGPSHPPAGPWNLVCRTLRSIHHPVIPGQSVRVTHWPVSGAGSSGYRIPQCLDLLPGLPV